jgi:hypothetical protein
MKYQNASILPNPDAYPALLAQIYDYFVRVTNNMHNRCSGQG